MRNGAKSVIFTLAMLSACSGQRSDEFGETLDGGDGDVGNGDAGVDAALTEDGGPGDRDAGSDAGADDAGPVVRQGVRVTVLVSGAPYAGARIAANDAEGALLEVLTADAEGVVQIESAVAMFTLLPPVDDRSVLDGGPLTYFGIEDGDALVIDVEGNDAAPLAGSYAVQMPGAYPGAVRYLLSAGGESCLAFVAAADITAPVTVQLDERCVSDAIDVLAVAVNADSTPIAFSTLLGVTPPAPDGVANLTLTAWSEAATLELRYASAPEYETYTSVSLSRAGHDFYIGGDLAGAVGRTQTLNIPAGFFDALDINVSSYVTGENSVGYLQNIQAEFASPFTVDPRNLLGPADPSVFDPGERIDLGAGLPAEADVAVIDVEVPVQFPEFTGTLLWTFVAPPQFMPGVLPVMPDEAGFTLAEGALRVAGVLGIDASGLSGFAAFKANKMLYDSYVEGNTVTPQRTLPNVLRRTTLSP